MSLKQNVAANYLGQGWRALMGLAFIPLYIKYLGIESYGLIGLFAVLQAWLGMLDMGMRSALGREMARFTGGGVDAQTIRDLLRSVELIALALAAAIGLGVWAASGWLASEWLVAKNLPTGQVARAFSAMGAVTGLQFVESLYAGCVAGLQRQVAQNAVTSLMATAKGLGAVGILAWLSPTVEAFFLWQGAVSLATVAAFAGLVYRALPRAPRPPRFSKTALQSVWRFAAGTLAITLLSLLLTQTDKILLSRLLPLGEFGHYTLAGVAANALFMLAAPISSAFYPRFTELAVRGDEPGLRVAYHLGAQLVTVLMGSAGVVLIVFSESALRLWSQDAALARQVAPLMGVLVLGSLLNGLMWIPYQMQLAHGWTSLTINVNVVAVAILIPALLWAVPQYGALGAAWIWVGLNASYLTLSAHFMYRRLLASEKWRWYRQDILASLVAALVTAKSCQWAMPLDMGWIGDLAALSATAAATLAAAALSAPLVRHRLVRRMRQQFRPHSIGTEAL